MIAREAANHEAILGDPPEHWPCSTPLSSGPRAARSDAGAVRSTYPLCQVVGAERNDRSEATDTERSQGTDLLIDQPSTRSTLPTAMVLTPYRRQMAHLVAHLPITMLGRSRTASDVCPGQPTCSDAVGPARTP